MIVSLAITTDHLIQ